MFANGFQSYFILFVIFYLFISTFFALLIFNAQNEVPISKFAVYEPQKVEWSNPYNLSILSSNDLNNLIDLIDFKFVMNNYPCYRMNSLDEGEEDIFIIKLIHSAAGNFHKRQVIRDTWGSLQNVSRHNLRSVFLLGQTDDSQIQKMIEKENKLNDDIVQGNFLDTYRNLTYKNIMGLKWVSYYCQSAKFILKTDDDIFVDMIQLVSYLRGFMVDYNPPKNFIACYVIERPTPKRSVSSKWFVSYEEYPHKYFPRYCYGWSVIMSPDIVFNLYAQSSNAKYFWIDDVFVTGLLAQKIDAKHFDLEPKLALDDDFIKNWLTDKISSLPPLFGRPELVEDSSTIYAMWKKTLDYHNQVGS